MKIKIILLTILSFVLVSCGSQQSDFITDKNSNWNTIIENSFEWKDIQIEQTDTLEEKVEKEVPKKEVLTEEEVKELEKYFNSTIDDVSSTIELNLENNNSVLEPSDDIEINASSEEEAIQKILEQLNNQ